MKCQKRDFENFLCLDFLRTGIKILEFLFYSSLSSFSFPRFYCSLFVLVAKILEREDSILHLTIICETRNRLDKD